MTCSSAQLQANRNNARHATGPLTPGGKQRVSRNALRHGLFAKALVLPTENTDDFNQLLDDLHTELRPVGSLESALVERIAVSLWRQQRLLRAESATIRLQLHNRQIARLVNGHLGLTSYEQDAVKESDLEPTDAEQLAWCEQVLQESEALDMEQINRDWTLLARQAPLIHAELLSEAADARQPPPEYIRDEWLQPECYVQGLTRWCRQCLQKQEQRAQVLALAETLRQERGIPQGDHFDKLNKYQVQLDREVDRALKALRDAQAWRLKTLDIADDGFVLENRPTTSVQCCDLVATQVP